MDQFHLIDQYLGTILDIDVSSLKSNECIVTETPRRLRCEQSYGFVHALYGIFFTDGRIAVSVTPGARSSVMDLLEHYQREASGQFDQDWLDRLTAYINHARSQKRLAPSRAAYVCKLFACSTTLLRRFNSENCRRLLDESIPPVRGLNLPTHCFPDGIVYGIVEDDHIVSVAYAHQTCIMEDQVADLAVETAEPYRNHGYATTVVSAVTHYITSSGGEAVYQCSVSNQASIATASTVGYVLYGRTIVVATPAPDQPE